MLLPLLAEAEASTEKQTGGGSRDGAAIAARRREDVLGRTDGSGHDGRLGVVLHGVSGVGAVATVATIRVGDESPRRRRLRRDRGHGVRGRLRRRLLGCPRSDDVGGCGCTRCDGRVGGCRLDGCLGLRRSHRSGCLGLADGSGEVLSGVLGLDALRAVRRQRAIVLADRRRRRHGRGDRRRRRHGRGDRRRRRHGRGDRRRRRRGRDIGLGRRRWVRRRRRRRGHLGGCLVRPSCRHTPRGSRQDRVCTPHQVVANPAVRVRPLHSGEVSGDTTVGVDNERAVVRAGVDAVGRSLGDLHGGSVPHGDELVVEGDTLLREARLVGRHQWGDVVRVTPDSDTGTGDREVPGIAPGELLLLLACAVGRHLLGLRVVPQAVGGELEVLVLVPVLYELGLAGHRRGAGASGCSSEGLSTTRVLAGRSQRVGGGEGDTRQEQDCSNGECRYCGGESDSGRREDSHDERSQPGEPERGHHPSSEGDEVVDGVEQPRTCSEESTGVLLRLVEHDGRSHQHCDNDNEHVEPSLSWWWPSGRAWAGGSRSHSCCLPIHGRSRSSRHISVPDRVLP